MNEAAVMRVRQYPPALLALGWLLEANDRSTTTSPFEAIEAVQDAVFDGQPLVAGVRGRAGPAGAKRR